MKEYFPYPKEILKHFRKPRNMGRMKNFSGVGKVGNLLCLLPEVKIHSNVGMKDIKDVQAGDLVLSHDGNYHPVDGIYKREYEGQIVLLKNRLGQTFLTPDHLVLAIKVPQSWKFGFHKCKRRLMNAANWYHAVELEKGDIMVYTIPKKVVNTKEILVNVPKLKFDFRSKELPSDILIDDEFLKLAGYYLSEGHANDKVTNAYVEFVFGINENEYIEDVMKIIRKKFGIEPKILFNTKTNSAQIMVYSARFARFLIKLFGSRAEEKSIPQFIMELPPEKQKILLSSLWKGDGWVDRKRIWPRANYVTISHQLSQQIKTLLLRQGIIPSLYEETEKVKHNIRHKKAYRIHVGQRESLIKLAKILGITLKFPGKISRKAWIDGNYLYIPITEKKVIEYSGPVYNLEVNGTKSFVSDSATIHNCGDVLWLYIKVKKNKKTGKEEISDVSFETFGCVVAIALSSMITTMIKGKTLDEALKLTNVDILRKLTGPLPPIKLHCSVLAADGLHEAIYDYFIRSKRPVPEKLQREHMRIQKTLEELERRHKEYLELERKVLEK